MRLVRIMVASGGYSRGHHRIYIYPGIKEELARIEGLGHIPDQHGDDGCDPLVDFEAPFPQPVPEPGCDL